MNKKNIKYHILIILFAIAAIFSALLSFVPVSKLCDSQIGVTASCSGVLSSAYGQTFGIPNSYLGLFVFSILFIVTFFQIKKPTKQKESILIFGIVISSLFAIYLIYLQLFILNEICRFCMVVDISSVLTLITIGVFGLD